MKHTRNLKLFYVRMKFHTSMSFISSICNILIKHIKIMLETWKHIIIQIYVIFREHILQ